MATDSAGIQMPQVLRAPIRPDVVTFTHKLLSCNRRQPYAVSRRAGHQTSAESWGTGRAVSRIPRVPGGGTHRAGQGAFGNMCRGGRMFAPTKIWRRWHRRVNIRLRRIAVASALAATAVPSLVLARGHRIDGVPEFPLVVSDSIESIEKTAQSIKVLKQIGAYADAEKAKDSVAIRAGKGKMRNRRYINRKGPLIVYGTEGSKVVKAFRNLPGVDVANVERLNLLDLAPGGHLGRFVIWTECAFKKLDEVYGGFDTPALKKKGFVLPRPKMANADLSRLINSDEVQSVVKPINKEVKRREARRNPLKNVAAVLKLNPYFGTARKMAALAEAARVKARTEKLDSKRTKLSPEESSKIKAAGKAWYKTMISDSDYTEFENFSKWLGVTQTAVPGLHLAGESQLGSSNPIGRKIGIHNTQEVACFVRVRRLGRANLTASLQSGLRSRIMKLKNRAEEIFRDGDLIFTSERNLGARNVQMDYDIVRANQPAVVQTSCRWIIGDVTEVLDRNTWKLGKIAKMLKNNYFVIRLADCIQLKEFHISSLRVPAAPHSSKQYSVADKKSEAKLAQRGQIPSDALPGRSNKKRKSTADTSFNPRKRTSHTENASRACVLDGSTTQNHFQFIREEATECSVASCSINDPETTFTSAKKLQSFGFPDDAMSACPCTSGMEDDDDAAAADDDDDDEEAAVIAVHELELEAYQSTMRALYASGPLTWEQESLLTNLRLSLNISNEEHLLQLRRLLSSR
uniref:ENT domain-containing protein n=1 Tax=Oryza punctata TaxID=4537 RepID=A0A0E0KK63_ORYPU